MKKKRVVLVLPNTAYGRQVIAGITRYAMERGGWEFLYKGHPSDRTVLFKAAAAAERWADGVIAHFLTRDFLEDIRRLNIPAVNVSSWYDDPHPVRVHADEFLAGKMAAEYFLECGIKSFAYWGYAQGYYSGQRCAGFLQTVRAAGYHCEIIHASTAEEMTRAAWMETEEQLGRRLMQMERPVGVLCVNDLIAREVLWVGERLDMHCPDDLAVLGCENDELACSVCLPPLSSVDLSATKIGRTAAQLLDQVMSGEPPPTQPVLVPPFGVVRRQSTDVATVANAEVRDAIRFIRDHAHERIDVSDVLRAVPISRRALEMHFKRILRRTPRQQIQYERVQRVKRLLLETDLSVARVAERAGFTNPSLCWVVFRRHTGLGPKEYRRQHS